MNTPGTGMATLFYVVSILFMPLHETALTLAGRSSWARWRFVLRQLLLALAVLAAFAGTVWWMSAAVVPEAPFRLAFPALAFTAALFVCYLVIAAVLSLVPPRKAPPPLTLRLDQTVRPRRHSGGKHRRVDAEVRLHQ